MNKQFLTITLILSVLLVYILFLMPYLSQRTAVNVANNILTHWKNDNQVEVFDLWIDPKLAPPIYNIKSYDIVNTRFYKEKKVHMAEMDVEITLKENNFLKGINEWELLLERTRYGWLAKSLRPKP